MEGVQATAGRSFPVGVGICSIQPFEDEEKRKEELFWQAMCNKLHIPSSRFV
jgi:hypothetical protein